MLPATLPAADTLILIYYYWFACTNMLIWIYYSATDILILILWCWYYYADSLILICWHWCRGEYCQAQPKLQVKHSLKAELALFPFDQATPTPTHPHPHPHPRESIIFRQFASNLNQTWNMSSVGMSSTDAWLASYLAFWLGSQHS